MSRLLRNSTKEQWYVILNIFNDPESHRKIFRISPSSSVMQLHFQLGLDVPTSMVHKAQQVPRYLYFRVDRDYRFSQDTNPLINRRKRSFEQLVTIWIERASCLHIRRMATSSNSAIPLQLSLIHSVLDLWNFFFLSFFLFQKNWFFARASGIAD